MEDWLVLRFLEDRACKDYSKCLASTAKKSYDNQYVPCCECMGGIKVPQTFHCPKPSCQTVWVEDSNTWITTRRIKCPFCNTTYPVMLSMVDGAIHGAILPHGARNESETR